MCERQTDRQTDRDRETEIETERARERGKGNKRERGRGRGIPSVSAILTCQVATAQKTHVDFR